MHLSDMYPDRPGLEVFTIHENEEHTVKFRSPGAAMRDAKTGETIWKHSLGVDVGACLAADIDPRHLGYEAWGGPGGLRDRNGKEIGPHPRIQGRRFLIWWDGDLLRELLSNYGIVKWNWEKGEVEELMPIGPQSLAADLIGDWREELLVASQDGQSLRLYTTTIPTKHRIYTLMHDPQYRLAIAWQNVVYTRPSIRASIWVTQCPRRQSPTSTSSAMARRSAVFERNDPKTRVYTLKGSKCPRVKW
jgi:rhamnogalacturonan endolyase